MHEVIVLSKLVLENEGMSIADYVLEESLMLYLSNVANIHR